MELSISLTPRNSLDLILETLTDQPVDRPFLGKDMSL